MKQVKMFFLYCISCGVILIPLGLLGQSRVSLLQPILIGERSSSITATNLSIEKEKKLQSTISNPFLIFPLKGKTPWTAPINSIFDHSMSSSYTADNIVVAYTGEKGESRYGFDYVTTFNGIALYGFKNSSGSNFTINGNYTGGDSASYLYYDGHPGYDYRTIDQGTNVPVLAAAPGIAYQGGSTFGTVYIDHGNGFRTYYLHLINSTRIADGTVVTAGQQIGIAGSTGAGAVHLHFEVRKDVNGQWIPVDPYGWDVSIETDPYTEAENMNLWLGSSPKWVETYNGKNNKTDAAYAIVTDNSGNIYVAGESQSEKNGYDIVTIKYNSSGSQQWIKRYNGPGNGDDRASAIALDSFGNIIVFGEVYGGFLNRSDYVVIKYDPTTGDTLWTRRYNGAGNGRELANGLAIDNAGNIYVTGYSYGGFSRGDDFLTIKYDPYGNVLWTRDYHYDGDGALSLVLDDEANVYVTGVSGTSYNWDYATIKYNTDGVEQWVSRYNGTANGEDWSLSVGVDSYKNVYVTGFSEGINSDFDIVTIKYNSYGDSLWIKRYNGAGNGEDRSFKLLLDNLSNIYITGWIYNTNLDIITLKYDRDGNQKWISNYNGIGNDDDQAWDVSIDNQNNVYIVGTATGADGNFDCITLSYDDRGFIRWYATFKGDSSGNDYNNSIAVTSQGKVYTAGRINNVDSGDDFVILNYPDTLNYVITGIESNVEKLLVKKLFLFQNYPNPFNPSTTIQYDISKATRVKLEIYNTLGQKVRELVNDIQPIGRYWVVWDGRNDAGSIVSSGIYFYILNTPEYFQTRKMLLVR